MTEIALIVCFLVIVCLVFIIALQRFEIQVKKTHKVESAVIVQPQQQKPQQININVTTDPNSYTAPVVFGQVGYLSDGTKMLPLYGEPSQTRRGRFYYYTVIGNIKLPLMYKNRDCMEEVACEELYDGEEVRVQDMSNETWTVRLYERNYAFLHMLR